MAVSMLNRGINRFADYLMDVLTQADKDKNFSLDVAQCKVMMCRVINCSVSIILTLFHDYSIWLSKMVSASIVLHVFFWERKEH